MQHHLVRQVGHARRTGRGGRPPAGSPASCGRRAAPAPAARAGRSRTTTTSASRRPLVGVDADDPAVLDSRRSSAVVPSSTSTLRSPSRLVIASASSAHPAGDRPDAEVLLDVGPHPHPGRDVARVVAVHQRVGSSATSRSRSSLNALVTTLCSVVRVRSTRVAWPCRRGRGTRAAPGRRGAARPTSRRSECTWSTHCCPRPAPSACVDRLELRGPAARRHREHGAVVEAVLAHRLDRHQLQLALEGPAGLAEQVAYDGRQRGRRGARVPPVAVALDEPDRAAEPVEPLDEGDLVALLGQPGRGRRTPEATSDDHDARHAATLTRSLDAMARYFDVHPHDPQPRSIAQVVQMLREDALVAYPTDSCYALGSRLDNPEGAERIRRHPQARRQAPLHADVRGLRAARPARAARQRRVPGGEGGDPGPVHVHPAGHPRGAEAAGAPQEAHRRRADPRPPGGARAAGASSASRCCPARCCCRTPRSR